MTDAVDLKEQKTRRLITICVIVVLSVTTLAALHKAWRGKSAFIRWQPQLLELAQGEDVYRKDPEHPYPNTPVVGLLLWPLAKMPSTLGAFILFMIKVAMASLSVFWAIGIAVGRRRALPAVAVGLTLLLCARPIMSDLQHGNINILMLFMLMGALKLFTCGRGFASGVLIGLAVVFKVTPGLFLPYFFYKRQWNVLAGAALGGIIALLAPVVVFGWQHNLDLHVGWFDAMIRPYALEGTVTYTDHMNQSLPGLFYRIVTDSPGINQGPELGMAYINILSLDLSTAKMFLRGIMLAILAWLVFVCRTPTDDKRDWRLACEFSLIIIGMLMFSERSWKHHYVTMTLPFAVLVAYGFLGSPPSWLRRLIQGVVIFALVMMLAMNSSTIGWIYHGVAHKWVEAGGSYFWFAFGSLLAISGILLCSRGEKNELPASP